MNGYSVPDPIGKKAVSFCYASTITTVEKSILRSIRKSDFSDATIALAPELLNCALRTQKVSYVFLQSETAISIYSDHLLTTLPQLWSNTLATTASKFLIPDDFVETTLRLSQKERLYKPLEKKIQSHLVKELLKNEAFAQTINDLTDNDVIAVIGDTIPHIGKFLHNNYVHVDGDKNYQQTLRSLYMQSMQFYI
jgi:hypothetical protein